MKDKKIEFIGKSLLVDGKVLVLSDLHLGYGGSLESSGVMVPVDVYKEIFVNLEEIFARVGVVEKVILLGDVKHDMGRILHKEWKEIADLFVYLKKKCKNIIIVKGNHDNIIAPLIGSKEITLVNVFLHEGIAFFHGDKEFEEIESGGVDTWVLGHLHPAVDLTSGAKTERYKCFLEGKFEGRKVIIMPSFFPFNEGSDPRSHEEHVPWKFNFGKFDVRVVGENLECLEFGKLGKITLS